MVFSPDRKRLAVSISRAPGEVVVWDLPTKKMVLRFTQEYVIDAVIFGPGGKRLVCACSEAGDNVFIRDARTGLELLRSRKWPCNHGQRV